MGIILMHVQGIAETMSSCLSDSAALASTQPSSRIGRWPFTFRDLLWATTRTKHTSINRIAQHYATSGIANPLRIHAITRDRGVALRLPSAADRNELTQAAKITKFPDFSAAIDLVYSTRHHKATTRSRAQEDAGVGMARTITRHRQSATIGDRQDNHPPLHCLFVQWSRGLTMENILAW
jgi:hypothetical protein